MLNRIASVYLILPNLLKLIDGLLIICRPERSERSLNQKADVDADEQSSDSTLA